MNYTIETNSHGDKLYYVNNVLHREDGPAVEYPNGTKYWYKNGKLHRENGPAVEWSDAYKEWWLNNKYYGYSSKFTNETWKRFVKTSIFS